MANKYDCSDGSQVTQQQIDRNRAKAYSLRYAGALAVCECCGQRATESSHIVAQSRCSKILHRADLVWNPENFFPSCRSCHCRWHDNDTTLPGYDRYMEVVERLDPEGYRKRINFRNV